MHLAANSGYFIGCLLLSIPYFCIFLKRKDLRKEMLIVSAILLPFAFLSPFYIPEYWNPPYIFGYLLPFKIGIEDFIFMFVIGGVASVIYEFISHRKEVKIGKKKRRILWTPFILFSLIILVGEYIFPNKSIYTLITASIIIALFMVWKRGDLMTQSLTAGFLYMLTYFLLFSFFTKLLPTYIATIYTRKNLLGVYVFTIPIEELLFAFSVGAGWSIAYEYMFGYKTKSK